MSQLKGAYVTGNTTVSGAAANAWLDEASRAIKGAHCWNLPYADPDLSSLSHTPDGLALLKAATTLQAGLNGITCDDRSKVLAWSASGQPDRATTAAIHQLMPNATALVANTFYQDDLRATRATVDVTVNALVSDAMLSDVFTPVPDDGVSKAGLLAGQRWLAQTALIARDDVAGRTVIAAPPRDFEPSDELVAAIAAEDALRPTDKWLTFTDLDKLRAARPTATLKSPTAQTSPVLKTNLDPKLVANTTSIENVYGAFRTILGSNSDAADPAIPFRTVATSWRGRTKPAAAYSAAVASQVNTLHNGVLLVTPLPLTLSGKSGKVPVTIKNNLPLNIRIGLVAKSSNGMRLSVDPYQGVHDVGRGGSVTVEIPVKAVGNGQQVTLTAELCQPLPAFTAANPTCVPYSTAKGGAVDAPVKVSAIGIIALGLMIGSAAVLVIAIGLRVYRANRAHHASAQDTMSS